MTNRGLISDRQRLIVGYLTSEWQSAEQLARQIGTKSVDYWRVALLALARAGEVDKRVVHQPVSLGRRGARGGLLAQYRLRCRGL